MMPLVSFEDDSNLQYINLNAKVYDFISHETKEWNIYSISSINVVANIRAIPIPYSHMEDRFLRSLSKMESFPLSMQLRQLESLYCIIDIIF